MGAHLRLFIEGMPKTGKKHVTGYSKEITALQNPSKDRFKTKIHHTTK
jgi:hypothetical protein